VRIEGERDIEQLRGKALLLLKENERLSSEVVKLLKENLTLKGMSAQQLQQALQEIDEQLKKTKAEPETRSSSTERRGGGQGKAEKSDEQKGHGPKAQPQLESLREEHRLDEADQKCRECGGQLEWWEGKDDETEEIDVAERRFVLKKHVRRKYRCKCGCIEMAELEPRLVPGGRYSNGFAVEVAYEKYSQHAPLERQARKMGGEGLDVESQTLWDQVLKLARALEPAYEALLQDALRQAVLGFDETRWELLEKGSASKKSWTMWQVSTRRGVYFTIAADRDTAAGNGLLMGFKGIALGDAYIVHKSMAKEGAFKLAFCWAHPRRHFIAAEASEPIRAKQLLDMVAELYAIEGQAPPGPEGDELRRKLRNEKSRPVTERIKTWLLEQRFLPGSPLGIAIKYMLKNWSGLTVFLDEPEVPIDNNRTERGFRGPALGRNNFYGSRSKQGTEVAAIFYSFIESAKLNGVEPKRYLKVALAAALAGERIPLPIELAAAAATGPPVELQQTG
jgi:transposase